MENVDFFKDYRSFVSFRPDRYGKATLFGNKQMLVGLNCLQPGQEMHKHSHDVQCRFYIVLEGTGRVWVGEEQKEVGTGMVIWIPAGFTHRVVNTGSAQLVMLVGFAPSKAD